MSWHRPLVSVILIFAVVASGLYVPVYHHGHDEHGAELDVHRVVHSHGGRVHVHVYHHHHHHGSDCHGHHSIEGDCHDHDHHDEHPEAEHAREILLSSAKFAPWKQVLSNLRLADDVQDAALPTGRESWLVISANVRPPPVRTSPQEHIIILQSVILRL